MYCELGTYFFHTVVGSVVAILVIAGAVVLVIVIIIAWTKRRKRKYPVQSEQVSTMQTKCVLKLFLCYSLRQMHLVHVNCGRGMSCRSWCKAPKRGSVDKCFCISTIVKC